MQFSRVRASKLISVGQPMREFEIFIFSVNNDCGRNTKKDSKNN
jgi:hypothetical protein